jgi:hypothetical protein
MKYAAQANPKIDAARGKKHLFRTKTSYWQRLIKGGFHDIRK